MRKLLLATSAAALALAFSGPILAEPTGTPATTGTIAPAETTTTDGLVFSKDADQAKPIEQTKPAEASKPADPAAPPTTTAQTADDGGVSAALRDLVENKLSQYVPREQDRAGVLAFYRDRQFAPIWSDAGKAAPRAAQAMTFLKGVAADGLDPADYPTPAFDDPQKLAADELMLTQSVLAFARHASMGRVAFSRVSGAVYFDQKAPAAADVLGKLADGTDVRASLNSYNPQSPQYKALKAELAAIRSGKNVEPKPAPEPKVAEKGKGKNKHTAKAAPKQEAKETTSATATADTVIANMERWRWMPHQLAATYVMVNLPDYTLKVVQNGKTVWTTKIVVGKPGEHATPLLTETMKYITVNPTWNVPPSIIKNEYLPALARDPNALTRIGLQMTHDKNGAIRIFQPPGDHNALGRIRFNFPNKFLVYQHDTPDKKLFALSARAYSHGCMRVQNPDDYAEVLLGITQPEEHYTVAKIRSMYGSTERNISLKQHIPVYITYQTAFTDDAGKVQARADIYGLDRDITNELHRDRRNADTPVARNYNSSSKPVHAAATGRPALSAAAAASNARAYGYSTYPGYTTWDTNASGVNLRSAYQAAPDRNRIW
jgi:murein L,D-transpeptidase YcbB/YkuD